MKNLLFPILLFFTLVPVSAQDSVEELLKKYNTGSVSYISVEQLRMKQLKDEVILLDTRSAEEFEVSHIEDALLVGYDDFDLYRLPNISKDKNIIVYCSLGIRSEQIGEKLKKAGFENVQNLFGGIFEWKNTGFPVVDKEGEPTEKVHAYSKQWAKWLKNGEKIY
ncbi:rhodanese-related sulfurtransferase [Christiangramia gaetbulicola]|uniref:Rhodanese-related sulfurtransferase n=1 Tax=Christiangramia gaetbulicola TaxID=703340 RepID=A0A2T6ALK9_9FLAO|nr:rhodanese-like domain-containing protein [Christiangramia gaetbulicola]PTX44695.1 rhodanese-related sulfurtransferase [Christiangramia gaetbulicola]